MALSLDKMVVVAFRRTEGYADVHCALVAEDALNRYGSVWPHEVIRDDGSEVIVGLERSEGYEDSEPGELAAEAISRLWSAWRLVSNEEISPCA